MGNAWKKAHPEAVRRHNSTPHAKLRRKINRIKELYGIGIGEYTALLIAQNDICALCREAFGARGSERPVLDHCHDSKRPRAFIHDRCNVGLGRFGDDAVKCRLAAEYLEKHHPPVDPAQTPKEK